MPTDAYHLDGYTTLNLQEADSSTSMSVAGIQDVTIIPNVSIEQLYTGDSIKIEEQFQHEFQVQVDIGYSLWDVDAVRQWLGGGGSSEDGSMAGTNQTQKFDMEFEGDSNEGSRTLGPVTISGITFEEMPIFDASQGEWVQWDLSGTGEDISGVSTTDNTA